MCKGKEKFLQDATELDGAVGSLNAGAHGSFARLTFRLAQPGFMKEMYRVNVTKKNAHVP